MGAEIIFGAISLIGTVVSTIGSMQQASAQQYQHEQRNVYQEQVNRNNAAIARADAEAVYERSQIEESDHRQRVHQTIGAARAVAAGRGFLIDQDTNQLLTNDIVQAGELDILRLRDDTALRQRQLEIEAQNFEAQGDLNAFAARSTVASPLASGFGTLLEGAGRAAGVFMAPSGTLVDRPASTGRARPHPVTGR